MPRRRFLPLCFALLFIFCAMRESAVSAAQPDEALKRYAPHKARADPPEKLPPEGKGRSGRGFLIVINGRYWRDVSKVYVDFEKSYISYDFYHYDRAPSAGH